MKTFFNLALSGLSETDAKKVLETLDSPKLGQWNLSEGGSSDLLIVDVDSVWGHMDWLRAVAEDRICAAYTDQESMRDCDLLLNKPLDSEKLTEMLLTVQGGTVTKSKPGPEPARASAGEKPAADPGTPSPAKAASPVPSAPPQPPEEPAPPAPVAEDVLPAKAPSPTPAPAPASEASPATDPDPVVEKTPATVGTLLLSGGISEPVLVGEGDVHLFIDPEKNVYRAPPQLKPIGSLLDLPATELCSVGRDDAQVQHAGPEQPIVRLLWFAALCASKGALAPHLDGSAIWKLTRWPQIEREFPRHFRIATAMMKQAGTLEDVATAAKSPVEDVAGFINAYYLAGYVAAEDSDEPVEAANSTANVLSRLRRSVSR